MNNDHANVHFPPPLIYLAFTLTGCLAEWFIFSLPIYIPFLVRITLSLTLGFFGLALIGVSFFYFKQTNQQPEPWTSTPEIITTGIYAYTRNPMYLGMGFIQMALGFALNYLSVIILLPLSLWSVYLVAIRHEENYLEKKFGDNYIQYKNSVRRWI